MFESAIQFAKKVFDVGNELGFRMNVLDIGGGFPGSHRSMYPFHQVSKFKKVFRKKLSQLFHLY